MPKTIFGVLHFQQNWAIHTRKYIAHDTTNERSGTYIMHTNPNTNQHYRRCANVSLVSRKYIHGTQIGDSTRNVLLLMLVLSVIDKIILVWPRFRFVSFGFSFDDPVNG